MGWRPSSCSAASLPSPGPGLQQVQPSLPRASRSLSSLPAATSLPGPQGPAGSPHPNSPQHVPTWLSPPGGGRPPHHLLPLTSGSQCILGSCQRHPFWHMPPQRALESHSQQNPAFSRSRHMCQAPQHAHRPLRSHHCLLCWGRSSTSHPASASPKRPQGPGAAAALWDRGSRRPLLLRGVHASPRADPHIIPECGHHTAERRPPRVQSGSWKTSVCPHSWKSPNTFPNVIISANGCQNPRPPV